MALTLARALAVGPEADPTSLARTWQAWGVDTTRLRVAAPGELDATTAYRLWQLRVAVFVVEQDCAYQELDGRDLEPTTRHIWVEDGDSVIGYLRILREPNDEYRIGRVCVVEKSRNSGVAARLMHAAVDVIDSAPSVADVQAHLTGWYARFGFVPDGPEFVEDGIPHVPMRRVATG
jgi:ElaA protein